MNYATALLAIFLAACIPQKEYSAELTEPAVVEDVIFQPSRHGSGVGVGMSMRGNMVVTSDSVTFPKKYAIVFRCQHGKFIVQGTRKEHKALWQKLKRGQEVMVSYREVYLVKDGVRSLVDYDFIDAK
jgi:hypothetical protein